jgi:hypothetical protein
VKFVLRVFLSMLLFVVWAFAYFWIYIFTTTYLFAKGLADSEWGWPIAGVTFLLFLFTYAFAINAILVRLDRSCSKKF